MPSSAYDFIITGKDQSGAAFDSLKRNAREADAVIAKLAEPLQEVQAAVATAETLFKGFIGYEVIRRGLEFHKAVQESVGALKTQADAVGFSTDALQAYQSAFRSANLNIEAGQAAIANLNVSIGRAAMGEKDAAEAFQQLGVRILDQNGKVRDNTAIVTEASRALLAIEDTATRAAVAKALFGKAGAQLTPVLRELARGLGDIQAGARAAGQIVSQETIETFDRLKNQADATGIRIRNMYAEIAAPVQFAAMQEFDGLLMRMAEHAATATTFIGKLNAMLSPMALMTPGRNEAMQNRVEEARSRVADMEANLGQATTDRDRARIQKALDQGRADLAKFEGEWSRVQGVINAGGKQTALDFDPDNVGAGGPGTKTKFAQAKPTGGAGHRDRIGEEMQQLTGNVEAARAAYENLRTAAATAVSSEDLQRQVELQKKISDELARIGKYAKDDPRVPQIKALVTEHERYEFAIKSLENALKVADATEKAYGDGKAAFAKTQYELNQALATGRLSQEAYTAANREAILVQQEQAAKAGQYKEGLDGVIAGMEYARAQAQRQNSAFQSGIGIYNESKQAFSGFITEVNQGLRQGADVWTTFANAGVNALNKISDKLLQMATDQLFAAAFPKAGGSSGGLGDWISNLFGGGNANAGGFADLGSGAGITNGVPNFTGMATGGPIGAGDLHLVGENGPELFASDRAGTIIPNHELGGDGAISVTVQNTNYFGSIVSRAEMEQQLMQVEERARTGAIAGVLDAKSRGGSYRSKLRR